MPPQQAWWRPCRGHFAPAEHWTRWRSADPYMYNMFRKIRRCRVARSPKARVARPTLAVVGGLRLHRRQMMLMIAAGADGPTSTFIDMLLANVLLAAAEAYHVALVSSTPDDSSTSTIEAAIALLDSAVAASLELEPAVALVVTDEFALLPSAWIGACSTPHHDGGPWCPAIRPPRAPPLPCNSSAHAAEAGLSCLARRHGVMLSVNVCEGQPEGTYNAQLIFAADGTLVARYRKEHPFYHECFLAPPSGTPPVALPASFVGGLELGVFTCLDIAFAEPAKSLLARGVRTFLYSSSDVAAPVKASWSKVHNATLLASDRLAAGVYRRGSRLEAEASQPGVVVVEVT